MPVIDPKIAESLAICTNLSVQHLWWTAISSTRALDKNKRKVFITCIIAALYYSTRQERRGWTPIKRICFSELYPIDRGVCLNYTDWTRKPSLPFGHSHLKRNNITILVRRKEALSGSRILQGKMKREQDKELWSPLTIWPPHFPGPPLVSGVEWGTVYEWTIHSFQEIKTQYNKVSATGHFRAFNQNGTMGRQFLCRLNTFCGPSSSYNYFRSSTTTAPFMR